MFPARTGPTAGARPRVFLALALLSSLVALYGCGTVIDREKLQDTVQASLENSVHAKIQQVECPADVSVDPGTTFTCTVIFSHDKRDVAILKIRNKDADITMVGLKPSK
ncbi:MAG TPA: DUF4333 domain-containing protein [Solirubrobacterales bacterium]|nr:DUF4333 domain-containing protein [Solirubrobacterales bacterium]